MIQGCSNNNTVGCEVLDGDNVISGNTESGIKIDSSDGNFVLGNFIVQNGTARRLFKRVSALLC